MWMKLLLCAASIVAPTEVQHIRNQGTEVSRQYVWVELPNKHRTCVPIINGILPEITCCADGSIVLDYSSRIPYRPEIYENVISYQIPQKVPMTHRHKKEIATVPDEKKAMPEPAKSPPAKTEKTDLKRSKMMRPSEVLEPKQEVRPRY